MSEDTITRCEGVFRCGTMYTRCRKEATLRKCGQYYCNSCAHWERFTRDTREASVTDSVTGGDNYCHPHETARNKRIPAIR